MIFGLIAVFAHPLKGRQVATNEGKTVSQKLKEAEGTAKKGKKKGTGRGRYERPVVPPRTQKQTAASLPTAFLQCRMMRHGHWDPFVPTEDQLKRHSWGVPIGWRCGVCGMERIDVVDTRGEISWRKYNPPEGYSIPMDKMPTTAVLRKEWMARMRDEARNGREITDAKFAEIIRGFES